MEVVRKDIKNLHVGVYPPNGRVRVATPLCLGDAAVRLAVVSRLGWIRRQQAGFERQERQSEREFVTGESHYVGGRRYRLFLVEKMGQAYVAVRSGKRLEMRVPPGTSRSRREKVLDAWYRDRLRRAVPRLIDKWEPRVGVSVARWGVRKMKTRWGSCNSNARRIWVNLELAKKPTECLEYVVVHEMLHLLERKHSERFRKLLDAAMPRWERRRDELNRSHLGHAVW